MFIPQNKNKNVIGLRTDLADFTELSIIRLSMQKQSPRTPKLQRTQNIQQNRFLTADLITPTSTHLIKVIMFIYICIYTDANKYLCKY